MEAGWVEDPKAKLRTLYHHTEFYVYCSIVCEHGNYSLEPEEVSEILRLHLEGRTCREIGKDMDIYYSTVFRALKKLIEWAGLV